jgi:hypothetical protein
MQRVLIAITTGEGVPFEVMESIYGMTIPEGVTTDLKIIRSYSVSKGRNELVHHAMNNRYDYIFFVDSDVILPKDSLEKLYNAKKLVINGTYPRKEADTITNQNPWTTLYRHDPSLMQRINFGPYWLSNNELPKDGIIPVDAAGLGCTLIHMSVFTQYMKDVEDWFVFAKEDCVIENGPYCLGEDLFFYRECLRHGVQPFAHGAIRCGHLGKFIYSLPDVKPTY